MHCHQRLISSSLIHCEIVGVFLYLSLPKVQRNPPATVLL